MRNLLIRICLKILQRLKYKPVIPSEQLDIHADFVVNHVEEKFPNTSGEFKRSHGLRMLLNITGAAERDCALALEKAVHRCLPR
jgi:hypothetical protein